LIMRIREAKAAAQEVSGSAECPSEGIEASGRESSGGEIRESAEEGATLGFGRPTPGTAPERRSGVWSTHRLDDPTGCTRDEGCQGGEDMGLCLGRARNKVGKAQSRCVPVEWLEIAERGRIVGVKN
jgi:hypothetical protein